MEIVDARARLRRPFVIVRAYLGAARHLVPLVAPAAVVFLPLALIAASALLPLLSGSAVVRNDELGIFGAEPRELLVWSAAVLVVFTVAQAVVFPATVVIAAGVQAGGQPVSARRALRMALRRLPSMLLLVVLAVPVFALVVAAGFGALLVTGSMVPAVFVFVGLALFTMPALLAVPAIVLEGRSALVAVGRGYDLVIGHSPSSTFTLACGVYVIPGAVSQALDVAMAGLHGPALMYASGLAGGVLALAGTAFQASVVTRQFLHRLALRPDPVSAEELDRILSGLPEAGPRRGVWFPLVLPGLVLPGLVYGGVATVNPFGWLETSETDVTAAWRDSFEAGIGAPQLGRGHLRALYPGPGTGMAALVYGGFRKPSAMFACADHTCRQARLRYAEAGPDQDLSVDAVGAALPDGRLVLTAWTWHRREWDSWESLGLLICDQERCIPPRDGSPLIPRHDFAGGMSLALTTRPGGGLVVATADQVDIDQGPRRYDDVISLISCADTGCSRPVTREVARVPSEGFAPGPQTLSVAVGADDRPVVARMDSRTGEIHVISCEDPACTRPHVTRPVAPQTIEPTEHSPRHAVAVAVRPDGRPVLAYQDIRDSAVKYVDCRTRDCAQHVTVTLSGQSYAPPVPVIDRAGRVLVAYQDARRPYVMLATCADGHCSRTAVSGMRNGPGDCLAMMLDRAGRPVIVWTDDNGLYFSDSEWALMVTTPLNLAP
ncbi:hypothetical protein [Nonomuraea jabiensis]|uniref:Uncharacterized protein n=1 Tax=Nonomuraea jabiensis TaxID=882448 RepID=A0A7W9FXU2_9ACTN|nr:hypothetical protein [Nonomuraea jabiensis]MBB5773523.1 hypothetical protein [Nonomuraea jabiensis]